MSPRLVLPRPAASLVVAAPTSALGRGIPVAVVAAVAVAVAGGGGGAAAAAV